MKKNKPAEEWIELHEAVAIMSEKHGRPIAPGFITRLVHDKKIDVKPKDGRTNLYLKSQIEAYTIKTRSTK